MKGGWGKGPTPHENLKLRHYQGGAKHAEHLKAHTNFTPRTAGHPAKHAPNSALSARPACGTQEEKRSPT